MKPLLKYTKDYLLLIDPEAKIYQMDFYLEVDCDAVTRATLASDQYSGCKKIIAYYPLSKEAKELDLPLLPVTPRYEWGVHETHCCSKHGCKYGDNDCCVELGIAKQRYPCENCNDEEQKFSLEDLKKAWEDGRNGTKLMGNFPYQQTRWINKNFEEFIQSLSTQQLPKEFILGEGKTIEEKIKNGYYI